MGKFELADVCSPSNVMYHYEDMVANTRLDGRHSAYNNYGNSYDVIATLHLKEILLPVRQRFVVVTNQCVKH